MRLCLFVAAAAMLSINLAARADTVSSIPSGSNLGTSQDSINGTAPEGVSYTDTVYKNPNTGLMDFVIQVDDTGTPVVTVSTNDFSGYSLSYAYENDGYTAPSSVTASGQQVTFTFNDLSGESDPLIIYTDANSYQPGNVIFYRESGGITDPPGLAPADTLAATPEPSSVLLLGTGLLGVVGVMRKRFA